MDLWRILKIGKDVATSKLITPTDQDETTEETDNELSKANDSARDLVLTTTSKGLIPDQNSGSGTIFQESPNLGNDLNQHLGEYEPGTINQSIFSYFC